MSRNIKFNLKNFPSKILLKTEYNKNKGLLFHPSHNRNTSKSIVTNYESFHINDKHSKNIKNKSRNCSKSKNLIANNTSIKRSFSIYKTHNDKLNISKISKKQGINLKSIFDKSQNKIFKEKKIRNLLKNKSINNIHINNNNNEKKLVISNNKKSNSINNSNVRKTYMSKNYFNSNNESYKSKSKGRNYFPDYLKTKVKNLNMTINNSGNHSNINIYNNLHTTINKSIHKKINLHKTCINTPMESYRKLEKILKLSKDIEKKEKEIFDLKKLKEEKDEYIKNLENKLSTLNINKNIDNEYEKYSKIVMVKNVQNLTRENEELHKQIKEYQFKEKKIFNLLQNMKKKGVDINNVLKILDIDEKNIKNDNNEECIIKYNDLVLKTDTTNNTNNTFMNLNLDEKQKNLSSKSSINLNQNIPILPLKNINEYYNENYNNYHNTNNIKIQIINNYESKIFPDNN